jgi:ABC-type antimicrobial peptide transport system permease subunit
MFAFAGALLLFIQFKGDQPTYVTNWVISSVLLGLATVLFALKDALPAYIPFELANGLNIASYIYVYASCLGLLGTDIRVRWIAVWALLMGSLFMIALMVVRVRFDVAFQPAVVALGGMACASQFLYFMDNFFKILRDFGPMVHDVFKALLDFL